MLLAVFFAFADRSRNSGQERLWLNVHGGSNFPA